MLRIHDLARRSGRTEELAAKEHARVSGMTWTAFKQGSRFTGAYPVPLGSFSYQLLGCRFLCCMDIMEMMGIMQEDGKCPEEVSPEMAPEMMQDNFVMQK